MTTPFSPRATKSPLEILQNLPIELTLLIHSFHDTFRENFQQQVLPNLKDHVREKLLQKAFAFLSNVEIQEALHFIMDDNQFNYDLVQRRL
jgi:hypothetical protein